MAYVKKTVAAEAIKTEGVEKAEPVVAEEKPAKKTVVKEDNSAAEIAALKAQIEMLMKLVTANAQAVNQPAQQNEMNDYVKIVHLVQRGPGLSTYMKLSNLELVLTEFGEERYVTIQQFEEMIGKYRRWFDSGMLSVAAGYDEVARRYGLKTAEKYPMDSEFIKNLGDLNMSEIEKVYNRLPESGKEFIISYWKRKVISGDPNFKDIRKIETLDRISDGGMENVIVDLKAEKMKK